MNKEELAIRNFKEELETCKIKNSDLTIRLEDAEVILGLLKIAERLRNIDLREYIYNLANIADSLEDLTDDINDTYYDFKEIFLEGE